MKKLLVASLSEKCNLNCAYCNVDKNSKKVIDPELFLIEYFNMRSNNPDDQIQIDFYGGEPLLQLDTIKIILDRLKDEPNIRLFMPTNGLLLTDTIVDLLIEHDVNVSISFDGLWQDKNRLQPNNKGTLKRYIEKRELFHRLPNVKCHTMVTQGCYNLLENHLYIRDVLGVTPELTIIRDVGTWKPHSVKRLKEGIDELFEWYIKNPHEEIPYLILFYMRHYIDYHARGVKRDNCSAGNNIFMFVDNQLLPCTRFNNKPEMIAEIPTYARLVECDTCEVQNYCTKGCLHEQILNKGPIVELCDIYKHMYNNVSSMVRELRDNPYFKQLMIKEL